MSFLTAFISWEDLRDLFENSVPSSCEALLLVTLEVQAAAINELENLVDRKLFLWKFVAYNETEAVYFWRGCRMMESVVKAFNPSLSNATETKAIRNT